MSLSLQNRNREIADETELCEAVVRLECNSTLWHSYGNSVKPANFEKPGVQKWRYAWSEAAQTSKNAWVLKGERAHTQARMLDSPSLC